MLMPPIITINPEPIEIGTEQMAARAIEVCSDVFGNTPIEYASLSLESDVLMVAGGIKAGTEVNFVSEAHIPNEVEKLQTNFAKHGLRLEFALCETKGNHPVYHYYLYDPIHLAQETAESKLAPQYNNGSVLDWLENGQKSGYNIAGMYGKFYSFPESAVIDFLNIQRNKIRNRIYTILPALQPKTNGVQSYKEVYRYIGPPKQDVVDRENLKVNFFHQIEQDQEFLQLLDSPRYKTSKYKWQTLHPIARQWATPPTQ